MITMMKMLAGIIHSDPKPNPDSPPEKRRLEDNSYTYEDEYGNVHWSMSDEDEE